MTTLKSVRRLDDDGSVKNNANGTFGHVNGGFVEHPDFKHNATGNSFYLAKDKSSAPPTTRTTANVWKNLIAISFGFFFLFTAFSALGNIQSSLNQVDGLGTACLSIIYGALVLSCMFVPSVLIKRLGCKWTMVMMPWLYAAYMAANFNAQWSTMVPTSILVGLAAAPLWSAKCTYLTQIGTEYAALISEASEVIIVRFFGIFFMMFQSGQIIGNLISSLVLDQGDNSTITDEQLGICGAVYCNEDLPFFPTDTNTTTTISPIANQTSESGVSEDKTKVYMLCGIYLGFAILASLLLAVFVDRLERSEDSENASSKLTGFQLLLATFRQMKNVKQILLIPLTIFSGIEQGFLTGDFTKAFVTCPLGIDKVGYVMICYGIVDASCSVGFGPLVKKFGRLPLYLLGASINVSVAITLLKWTPNPDQFVVFFVLAGLWGMADAIWQTQINAFYGVIFTKNEEAAFSNYRLWESLGFIIAFAISSKLCINQKLYILLAILAVGISGYLVIECMIRKEKQSKS